MAGHSVIDRAGSYAAQFSRLAPVLAASEPGWMTRVRRQAFDAFDRAGFPTTRDEEWRFTNVRPISEAELVPAGQGLSRVDPAVLEPHRMPGAAVELVFVNGRFAPELSRAGSLPVGVHAGSLASALRSRPADVERHLARVAAFEQQSFVALNSAFWEDGAFLFVPGGVVVGQPVHVLFASFPGEPGGGDDSAIVAVTHPRVLVVCGPNSHASIVETYAGSGAGRYFTNTVTEVSLGDHARVEHYKLQREAVSSYHVATLQALAAPNATFSAHSISFGGALVRNDAVATLAGEGGECTLDGLYFADGTRLVDNHTVIDHAKPHCSSREMYKGILAGHARGVFNGKIVVRPDAQKTDAKQTNKALLLSGDAQINTKPQLEIFANDVRCTHGAAVGQMDEDALFYLRARGLPLEEARQLLIQAFAGEVLDRMPLKALRTRVESELLAQLASSRGRS